MKHNIEWFNEKVGQKIFRMPTQKGYDIKVIEVIIIDLEHANYLMLSQDELGLNYWSKQDSIIRKRKGG